MARIEVAGGWIEVKEYQTVKDEREVIDFAVVGENSDGSPKFRVAAHRVGKCAARIVGWQFDGVKPYPTNASFERRVAAIDDLRPALFKDINVAVLKFESDLERSEDEEKNASADGVVAGSNG